MRDNNVMSYDVMTKEEIVNTLISIVKECFHNMKVMINIDDLSIGVETNKFKILITGIDIYNDNKYMLAIRVEYNNMYVINKLLYNEPSYIDSVKRYLKVLYHYFAPVSTLQNSIDAKYQELLKDENKN